MIALRNYAPSRYDRAVDRDIRDAERLAAIDCLISQWLDELVPFLYPLEHPRIKWQPADVAEALREQLESLRAEVPHLTGPLFIDEDE
jgi:hypothetical protein